MWTVCSSDLTTHSITAVSVSSLIAHSTRSGPVSMKRIRSIVAVWCCSATWSNTTIDSTAAAETARHVTSWAKRSPSARPRNPARKAAISGRKTMAPATYAMSALHQMDVFHRDRAAVAEVHHENGKPDRRLGRRHGQHEHGEDLAGEVAKERGERHEVYVHREQHQLDRHQDDDHVPSIEEGPEDADREERGGNDEIV